MSTIREFVKSLLESYSDRLKSPLLGSFAIVFVFYNWQPIVYLLFSQNIIELKLDTINIYYTEWRRLWFPLLLALLYILGLPWVNLGIDKMLKKVNSIASETAFEKQKSVLQRKVETASLLRNIEDAKAGTSEIRKLRKQIEVLENDKNKLEENILENKKYSENNLEEYKKIIKSKEDMLIEHSKTKDAAMKEYMESKEKLDKIMLDYSNLKANYNILKNDIDSVNIKYISVIESILDKMSFSEREVLYQFYLGKGKNERPDILNRLLEMDLLSYNDTLPWTEEKEYRLTPLGELVVLRFKERKPEYRK